MGKRETEVKDSGETEEIISLSLPSVSINGPHPTTAARFLIESWQSKRGLDTYAKL